MTYLKIVLIFLMLILLIAFAICCYAYHMAFKAPKRTDYRNYTLPPHEQYLPHHATLKKCMDSLLARPFEEIYISSYDNLKLYGRLYEASSHPETTFAKPLESAHGKSTPKTTPVHLLFHGYKSNPYQDGCGGSGLAAQLGHRYILVDQRAHGKSQGNTISFGINERRDVLSWVQYCKERFGADTPLILWGLSMGAATVLMASDLELPGNVKGIIADCPFSAPSDIIKKVIRDMHFSPRFLYPFVKLSAKLFGHFDLEECTALTAVEHTKVPILLFHGEDDRFVPHEMSRLISNANLKQITFESIPGAGHGLSYMVESNRYRKAVLKFIDTILTPTD